MERRENQVIYEVDVYRVKKPLGCLLAWLSFLKKPPVSTVLVDTVPIEVDTPMDEIIDYAVGLQDKGYHAYIYRKDGN